MCSVLQSSSPQTPICLSPLTHPHAARAARAHWAALPVQFMVILIFDQVLGLHTSNGCKCPKTHAIWIPEAQGPTSQDVSTGGVGGTWMPLKGWDPG